MIAMFVADIAKLDHAATAAAIHHWHHHLSACIKAGSAHFEHRFWTRCTCRGTT